MSIWQRQKRTRPIAGPLLMECLAVSTILVLFGCQPNDSLNTDTGSQVPAARKTTAAHRTGENAECLICHMDFESEELSVKHDEAGTGCISCHGASLAHGDDELNITPPDKLFGRAEIERFCKGCHPPMLRAKFMTTS